jgi:cytochrome c oxidase subunit 2
MAHELSQGDGGHGPPQPVIDNSGRIAAILIGVVAGLAGFLMYRFDPFLTAPASTEGISSDWLFSIFLGVGTAVFVMVQGILLYAIIRFARQPDDETDGPAIRGHVRLEVVWTLIPALAVVILGALSYQVLALAERPNPEEMVVEVLGSQYAWQFYYPEYDLTTTELHAPLDRTVLLKMRSKDVVHSFWVPAFRIKKDLMPDRVTETRFTATEIGVYPIVCAELCGAGHALMRSQVVVQSEGDYRQWVASQTAAARALPPHALDDPLAIGRTLFGEAGCNACHALTDANAVGEIGPDLDGIGSRAGATVPGESAEDYLLNSIVKPNSDVVADYPANVMPPDYRQRLSDDDLSALTAYLLAQH